MSNNAIDIGKIALITGPILGIIFKTIAIIALETTYLISKIDNTIKDKRPTNIELITIENIQFESAILDFSIMFLNLFLNAFGVINKTPSLYEFGSIEIIKLTTKTKIKRTNPDPRLPAILIIFIKLSLIAFAIVAPSGNIIKSLKILYISKILSASLPYKSLLILSKFELKIKFILVRMFGTSISNSLTSSIKGGKMRNTEARKMKARNIKTKNSDNDLGIFKIFLTLLVRLQIILAITKEQIIRRRKSLRLQKIRQQILKTNILKKIELFNFY